MTLVVQRRLEVAGILMLMVDCGLRLGSLRAASATVLLMLFEKY